LRSDVRDIADPYAIRNSNHFGRERPFQHVLRDRLAMIGIRRHAKSLARLAAQPGNSHDSSDPFATAPLADFSQVCHDPPFFPTSP